MRSESDQGHIPGASNLPLFSNAEQTVVGTCYKQQGREAAVDLGLQLVGPKLAERVAQARAIARGFSMELPARSG